MSGKYVAIRYNENRDMYYLSHGNETFYEDIVVDGKLYEDALVERETPEELVEWFRQSEYADRYILLDDDDYPLRLAIQ